MNKEQYDKIIDRFCETRKALYLLGEILCEIKSEEKHPNCRCGGEAYAKELEIGGWYVGCKDCHISTTILPVEEDVWAAWDKVMK